MTLNAPSQTMFIVAVVIAVVALIGQLFSIAFIGTYAFWILIVAFIVLAAAVMMKGA
ncbi:MAG TPA: hypothetical protein VGV07_03400 [Devosia sp.]|jgi:polyferredoxin|uniref:hypothetical protein n=1 Tax=Devosia sp. TaxID=1871048 RepID=UPI002DDCADCB|nr:hypothetical protein [Devosia sp.]HEV2514268.1 hypothetical protein [Devosia sp.]